MSHDIECQVIGPFEFDAAHFVPRPRHSLPPNTDGHVGDRVRAAKSRWLQAIMQNMVPGEHERLRIADERGFVGHRVEVECLGTDNKACGNEVGISSTEYLTVYDTKGSDEGVTYVPWETIVRIKFCRRRA